MYGESPVEHGGQRVPTGSPPTCMGKAFFIDSGSPPDEDHPHMCGESSAVAIVKSLILGSPPHVWGKPTRLLFV